MDEVCKIIPGVPCKPMLAKPTKGIDIIFKRFEGKKFTCEYKYDGLRGQLHYQNGEVTIFSRNLENLTQTYPDILALLSDNINKSKVESFIADSEIVAVDADSGRILPFQNLMTRSKKNVTEDNIKVKVCLYVFDFIFLNGISLLEKPLRQRRELLMQNLPVIEGQLEYVVGKETDDVDEIQVFLNESVEKGCEGLMVKTLDENATYEPSKRSFKWLKLKNDYLDRGLGDTFDLVPIGAVWGSGKRVGTYSSFLMASYNPNKEIFETTTFVSTGFTDNDLISITELLKDTEIKEPQDDYRLSSQKLVIII